MKPGKAPAIPRVTSEVISLLGQDCELLERFVDGPARMKAHGRHSGVPQNAFEAMLESLLVKTVLPSRSPPRFSPEEFWKGSFLRLARAGFGTAVKRRELGRAVVSAGLIRRMTLGWLGATMRGAPARNVVRMFWKDSDGGRLLGLPAYDAGLAWQISSSPALLKRYLQSDERAFELMMERGGSQPVVLNMPALAILLVSIYASRAE